MRLRPLLMFPSWHTGDASDADPEPVRHTCVGAPPWETCQACEEELHWYEQHSEDEYGMEDGERRYLLEHEVIRIFKTPGEVARAALEAHADAIMCGGEPSASDLQVVAEFGRFLEQAGPPPRRESTTEREEEHD